MGRIVELRASLGDFVKADRSGRIEARAAQMSRSEAPGCAGARQSAERPHQSGTHRRLLSRFVTSRLDRADAEFRRQAAAGSGGRAEAAISKGYDRGYSNQRRIHPQRGGRRDGYPGAVATAFDPNDMRVTPSCRSRDRGDQGLSRHRGGAIGRQMDRSSRW
jgi:hypothetical protein